MTDLTAGTPVVTLGFTRDELDLMEEAAFPEPIETWIHGLITAAVAGDIEYKHAWATEPSGDAFRESPTEDATNAD